MHLHLVSAAVFDRSVFRPVLLQVYARPDEGDAFRHWDVLLDCYIKDFRSRSLESREAVMVATAKVLRDLESHEDVPEEVRARARRYADDITSGW